MKMGKTKLAVVMIIAVVLFAQALATLSCSNGLSQVKGEPKLDGPTMVGGDIRFQIDPRWTNAEAVKAVNQGLRLLTGQSDELTQLFTNWYEKASWEGRWDLMDDAQKIITAQAEFRKAYGKDNLDAIKQADGISGMITYCGSHSFQRFYMEALHKASYMEASTNATPAELAVIQAELDALSEILVTRHNSPELPKTNIVQHIKGQLYFSPYVYPSDASSKIVQQCEDYGQFMAFADDLTRMGHTLNNLSNRSVQQNFVIEDNYTETPPPSRAQAQELAGILK